MPRQNELDELWQLVSQKLAGLTFDDLSPFPELEIVRTGIGGNEQDSLVEYNQFLDRLELTTTTEILEKGVVEKIGSALRTSSKNTQSRRRAAIVVLGLIAEKCPEYIELYFKRGLESKAHDRRQRSILRASEETLKITKGESNTPYSTETLEKKLKYLKDEYVNSDINPDKRDQRWSRRIKRIYNKKFCQLCDEESFQKRDGDYYLEHHHIIPISEGGTNKPDNALFVCANCHKTLHEGRLYEIRSLLESSEYLTPAQRMNLEQYYFKKR